MLGSKTASRRWVHLQKRQLPRRVPNKGRPEAEGVVGTAAPTERAQLRDTLALMNQTANRVRLTRSRSPAGAHDSTRASRVERPVGFLFFVVVPSGSFAADARFARSAALSADASSGPHGWHGPRLNLSRFVSVCSVCSFQPTLGISCERPKSSTLASFIPLLDGFAPYFAASSGCEI